MNMLEMFSGIGGFRLGMQQAVIITIDNTTHR